MCGFSASCRALSGRSGGIGQIILTVFTNYVNSLRALTYSNFVGEIGIEECACPGPSAFGNGNDDGIAAGKLAGAAAEVPSHGATNLVA